MQDVLGWLNWLLRRREKQGGGVEESDELNHQLVSAATSSAAPSLIPLLTAQASLATSLSLRRRRQAAVQPFPYSTSRGLRRSCFSFMPCSRRREEKPFAGNAFPALEANLLPPSLSLLPHRHHLDCT
eukprot:760852-Hanusia_phi.AAC.6